MPLAAGTRLGPYEVLAKLGEGGMGEVYQARDTRLGRLAALKVIRGDWAADPDRHRRFIREAQSASALNHPAILTIYEIDASGGLDYIAMEYVAGERSPTSCDLGRSARTAPFALPPRSPMRSSSHTRRPSSIEMSSRRTSWWRPAIA